MNAVARQETQTEIIQRDKLVEYLRSFGLADQLTKYEANQFVEVALAFNLNPFKREIYCIPYGEGEKRKLSILTGYEVYLKRAERTGLLDGWKAWTEGTIEPKTIVKKIKKRDGGTWDKEVTVWHGSLKAIVEIYRKDRGHPFTHEVLFSEYAQDNEMWGGKPHTMIKKVAIGQAFRLAFPDECAGMPYTAEEVQDYDEQPRPAQPATTEAPAVEVQATVMDAEPKQKAKAEPKAEPKPQVSVEYLEGRTKILKEVSDIVGAKDSPDAWTEEQKEAIEAKKLAHQSKEAEDLLPLEVLLLRAKIGAKHKTDARWTEIMAGVREVGLDTDKLAEILSAEAATEPELEIY